MAWKGKWGISGNNNSIKSNKSIDSWDTSFRNYCNNMFLRL